MTDRRCLTTVLLIGAAMYAAGDSPWVVPCDAQNAVLARESAAALAPVPAPELTVDILVPEVCRPGTFIPLKLATNATNVNVAWLVNRVIDPAHILPGDTNKAVTFTGLEGLYEVAVVGTLDEKPIYYGETVKVGDPKPPEPPKPLNQLVTAEQAATLTLFYRATLSTVPQIPTPDAFWGVHAGKLATLSLTGSDYDKTVAARFEAAIGRGGGALDGVKLVGALEAVIKDLGTPVKPDEPTTTATAATYVYEKDDTPVPVGVSAGLNRLNREKNIRATLFEEDTVDGDGDVPDQYKPALAAARQAGLPALVVLAGANVLNVVKDPRTEQQVFEAIAP